MSVIKTKKPRNKKAINTFYLVWWQGGEGVFFWSYGGWKRVWSRLPEVEEKEVKEEAETVDGCRASLGKILLSTCRELPTV